MTQPATCKPCEHRTRHDTCAEPKAAGLADRFIIVWPPAGYAARCPAFTPKKAHEDPVPRH